MLVELEHEVSELGRFLERMDPFDLQYLYRFACGLNPTAGAKVIQYLKSIKDGDKFSILCILEQAGMVDDIKDTVKDLCSGTVYLRGPGCAYGEDDRPLQRSTIQILEIAARYDIPIPCVYLVHCSPRVDESGLNIILESGLSLSILSSLQKLLIGDYSRSLTNEEWAAILSYSSQCTSLKELGFSNYHIPDSVAVESIPRSLKSGNVKVWIYGSDQGNRRLNLKTGRWQNCDNLGNFTNMSSA